MLCMTISKEQLISCATQAGTILRPSWPRFDSALTGSCSPSTARRSTLAVVKAMSTTWPLAKTAPPRRCRHFHGSFTAAGSSQSASYRCLCTGYAELRGARSTSRTCCVWLHRSEIFNTGVTRSLSIVIGPHPDRTSWSWLAPLSKLQKGASHSRENLFRSGLIAISRASCDTGIRFLYNQEFDGKPYRREKTYIVESWTPTIKIRNKSWHFFYFWLYRSAFNFQLLQRFYRYGPCTQSIFSETTGGNPLQGTVQFFTCTECLLHRSTTTSGVHLQLSTCHLC